MNHYMIVKWGMWIAGYCMSFSVAIIGVGLITDSSKATRPFIVYFIYAVLWASAIYLPLSYYAGPWRFHY